MAISRLKSLRSTGYRSFAAPAPSDAEIATIIAAASRVPDHGKLEPWRFILYRGETRVEVGKQLAALAESREGPLSDVRRDQELARFSRAPLVIGIVSVPKAHPKIPEWEKFLSGGMAAMNLMMAANALGYGTNMISNWYSDVPEGRALLGLAPDERVIGFVHIGTFAGTAPEAFIMDIPVQDVRRYESELLEFVKARHSDLLQEMRSVAKLTDDIREKLVALLTEFGEIFETSGE